MRVACPTCHRSWEATAAFCGACGDRLDTGLVQPARRPGADPTGRTTAPLLWVALGLVVVVVVTVAVPIVTIGREGSAVAGDVGVPDTNRVPTADARRTPTQQASSPAVQCQDAEGPRTDCLQWIQDGGADARVAADGIFGATTLAGTAISYTGGTVTAVDAATGTARWTRTFAEPLDMVAAHGDGLLVGAGGRARLLALTTGEQRWAASTADQLYGDLLTDELALTARRSGATSPTTLVARDRDTGDVRWTWAASSQQPLLVAAGDHLLVSQPQVQVVTALDPETGEQLWRRPGSLRPGAGPDGVAVLFEAVSGEPVSEERASLHVTVVDEDDGTVRWERTIPEAVGFADGGRLLLVTADEQLRAHDVRTGELAWQVRSDEQETPAHESSWSSGHDRAAVLVTATPGGILRGRDLEDGRVLWRRPATSGGDSQATVDGDVLQVRNGPVTQLRDARTGALVLTYRVTGWLLDVDLDAGLYLAPRTGQMLRLALPGR